MLFWKRKSKSLIEPIKITLLEYYHKISDNSFSFKQRIKLIENLRIKELNSIEK